MSQVEEAKFSCKNCGKSYKWKPEFAGRKVKCKCGYVMTAPSAPPGGDEPDLDALYDLADAGKEAAAAAPMVRCPSCMSEMEPGTAVCPACGFNVKTGKPAKAAPSTAKRQAPVASGGATIPGKPATAGAGAPSGAMAAFSAFGPPKRGLQQVDVKESKLLDLYIPLGAIALGLFVSVFHHTRLGKVVFPLPQAIGMSVIEVIISAVLLAVLCLFMMRLAEIAFGSPGPAALKLLAIAIAPAAIAGTVSELIHDVWGLVGFSIAFGIIYVMYHYLFEMDQSDIFLLGGTSTVVTMIAIWIIAPLLLATLPGFQSLRSGGTSNDDRTVANLIEFGRLKDGKEWVNDNASRIVGDLTHTQSVELVQDYIDAGAKSVQILPDSSVGVAVIIELPSNSKKRKAVFDQDAASMKKFNKGGVAEDKGQKYILRRFGFFVEPEM